MRNAPLSTSAGRGSKRLWCWVGLAVALAAAVAGIMSGFGFRLGLWQFRFGFAILRWSAYVAALGVALCILGLLLPRRGVGAASMIGALVGLLIGLAVAGYPVYMLQVGHGVPPIHDITTDPEHPPAFVAALPYRIGAENSTQYGGSKLAAEQRQAYPDVKPAEFKEPPAKVFDAALATAKAMGWRVIAAVPAEGRIEATDSTFWYHFTDDVVIRVKPDETGTRLDIRSESRVGRSDLGANAHRIVKYLAALKARVGTAGS